MTGPSAKAYVWGNNNTGELGLGHAARVFTPAPATFNNRLVDLKGGMNFSVALTTSGEVWTWGGNEHGQLGDGSRVTRRAPRRVRLPRQATVKAIAVGADHVIVLTTDHDLVTWGRNHRGQLGIGSREDKVTPRRVETGPVSSIGAGDGVSAAITSDGKLLVWGRNGAGQLPVVRKAGGTASDLLEPTRATAITQPVASVDAGLRHLVVLTRDGDVLAFGADASGRPLTRRIPLKPSWGRVRTISAGEDHTLALTSRGVLIGWGAATLGQLGEQQHPFLTAPVPLTLPDARGRVTQIRAGHRHNLALTDRDEVYAWGDGRYGAVGAGRPEVGATAVSTPQRISLPGAKPLRLAGGGYSSAVFVDRGPAIRLQLEPAAATVTPGRPVRFQVRVVDAFGTDLGPATGSLVLTARNAVVHGTTVTAREQGTYSVVARAGALFGTATLTVKKATR